MLWFNRKPPAEPEASPASPAPAGPPTTVEFPPPAAPEGGDQGHAGVAAEGGSAEASSSVGAVPGGAPALPVEVGSGSSGSEPAAGGEIEPEAKKGFWKRAWDVLNTPIPGTSSFGMDRQVLGQLSERLSATRKILVDRVKNLVRGRTRIDDELLEELEELLIEADMGVKTTEAALEEIRQLARTEGLQPEGVTGALASYLVGKLGEARPLAFEKGQLKVIMLVGVNGTGKTTTLGKLAHRLTLEGLDVIMAAADTFRAAAIDQLEVWAERAGVPLVRHAEGGDAAAVVFDALSAARSRNADVVLIDTAGRLHNKANLMAELQKIRKIVDREAQGVPIESLLVLDATTGQNGLRQAEVFKDATQLTGCILTKLDGTAKGGVVFSIRDELGLPVKLAGFGESLEDLRDFDPAVFVEALFAEKSEERPDSAKPC